MANVAVIGGTGQQGSSIVRAAKSRGLETISIARNAFGAADVRSVDLDRPSTLVNALAGVDTLVLTIPSLVASANSSEAKRGISVLDAALEAGVRHVIYSSALTKTGQGVLGLGSKRAIEERLRESGLAWTIVRPAFFMDNFVTFFPPKESDGVMTITAPLPLDRATQMVAVRDIGEAIGAVLANLQAHRGSEIDLVGEALSLKDVVAHATAILGREVRDLAIPPTALAATWPQGVPLFQHLCDDGTDGAFEPLQRLVDRPTTFRQWASEHFKKTVEA